MVSFEQEILLLSWQPCKYLKSYIDEIYLFDTLIGQHICMPKFVYMLLVALKVNGGGGSANPLGSRHWSKTHWVGQGLIRLESANTWSSLEFRDHFIVKHL